LSFSALLGVVEEAQQAGVGDRGGGERGAQHASAGDGERRPGGGEERRLDQQPRRVGEPVPRAPAK
jgi:hypothetical protein